MRAAFQWPHSTSSNMLEWFASSAARSNLTPVKVRLMANELVMPTLIGSGVGDGAGAVVVVEGDVVVIGATVVVVGVTVDVGGVVEVFGASVVVGGAVEVFGALVVLLGALVPSLPLPPPPPLPLSRSPPPPRAQEMLSKHS
jgi:hypothetical protein